MHKCIFKREQEVEFTRNKVVIAGRITELLKPVGYSDEPRYCVDAGKTGEWDVPQNELRPAKQMSLEV